jgi:hypothetical protein
MSERTFEQQLEDAKWDQESLELAIKSGQDMLNSYPDFVVPPLASIVHSALAANGIRIAWAALFTTLTGSDTFIDEFTDAVLYTKGDTEMSDDMWKRFQECLDWEAGC